ncbi:MAG: 30S ribosomal protein S20 [Lachnospirales bacterium]
MANIKSAKKRIKVIQKKTLRNKMIKTKTKSAVKKVTLALAENNVAEAKAALTNALKAIDKACSKGVFHKNTAARKKSRLTRAVNKAV